jgi:hypothetical protein
VIEAELKPLLPAAGESALIMRTSDIDAAVQNIVLFSMVWSLGASVDELGRVEFDREFRKYTTAE